MTRAKCFCCGATAIADTYDAAIKRLNHAIGLSRGIKCGAYRKNILEVKEHKDTPIIHEKVFLHEENKERAALKSSEAENKEETKQEEPIAEIPKEEIKQEKPKKSRKTKKSKTKS